MLKSCVDMVEPNGFEHRTRVMIEAATRRGIPWIRVSPIMRHVQLGQGARQQRLWNTVFGSEGGFGRRLLSEQASDVEPVGADKTAGRAG